MKKLALLLICAYSCLFLAGCADESEYDIDFTKLSATMVSAQLEKIMGSKVDYVGQIMKISGAFDPYFVEGLNSTLMYIMIDCPSGCAKFMEFKSDNHSYPNDYPSQGTMIEIIGEFKVYIQPGYSDLFPYLHISELRIIG